MYVKLNRFIVIRNFGKYGIIFDTRDYREKIIIISYPVLKLLRLLYEGNDVKDSILIVSRLFNLNENTLYKALRTLESKGIISFCNRHIEETINRIEMFKEPNTMGDLPYPLYIILNPTFRCNLRCVFCFYKPFVNSIKGELNIDDVLKILTDGIKCGIPFIDIIGGEPLLYSHVVDLINFIINNPFNTTLSTNGTIIPQNDLIRLIKKATKRDSSHSLLSISIALHGASEHIHDKLVGVRGAYKNVLKFISLLDDNDIPYSINTVILNENINELNSLAEKLLNMKNVVQWNLLYYTKFEYTEPDEIPLTKFFEIVRKIMNIYSAKINIQILAPFVWLFDNTDNCKLLKLSEHKSQNYLYHFLVNFYSRCSLPYRIEIFPDGTVTPCGLLTLFPPWKERRKFNTIVDAWNSDEFRISRKRTRLNICPTCRFRELCKNQCLAYVLDKGLSYNDPDPRCPNNKTKNKA